MSFLTSPIVLWILIVALLTGGVYLGISYLGRLRQAKNLLAQVVSLDDKLKALQDKSSGLENEARTYRIALNALQGKRDEINSIPVTGTVGGAVAGFDKLNG